MPEQVDKDGEAGEGQERRADDAAPAVPQPILLSNVTEPPPPVPRPVTRSAPPRPIQLETLAPPRTPRASTPPPVAAPVPSLRELFVPDGTLYTGQVLRRARETRGLTVEQVCERTRITRQHVENLELDRYDRLPAPVYLRGMLLALAKELRLDGQKVARSYLEALAAAAEGKAR